MNGAVVAETVRRHLASRGYLTFLFFLVLAAFFASTFNTPGSMWPSLVSMLAIITGSAIIGPEFSTGTLQLIVSKPVRRSVYLLSRVAGVFASVVLAAMVPLLTECVARLVLSDHSVPWRRLATVFYGELMVSLLIIAVLTFLGSLTRAYYNVAIYIGAQAALTVTLSILGMLKIKGGMIGSLLTQYPVERGIASIDEILFADLPPSPEGLWLLQVILTVAVLLGIGCIAFERREVPYASE